MVGLIYLLVPIIESAIVLDSATIDTAWYHYKAQFNKDYDQVREITRKPAFIKSLRYVITKNIEHDLTGHWYMAGLNAVSDFTIEELHCVKSPTYNDDVEMSLSREISANAEKSNNFNDIEELYTSDIWKDAAGRSVDDGLMGSCCSRSRICPDEIDWVNEKRVFQVGHQKCGDCYAWAATYALSSAWAISHTTAPLDLSVQQAKDCSYNISQDNICLNKGCNGGTSYFVYKGIKMQTKKKMIRTKDYRPYDNKNDTLVCDTASVTDGVVGATIQSYETQTKMTDCELIKALLNGPVAADICMSVNIKTWKTGKATDRYSNFNCTRDCQDEMKQQQKKVQPVNHGVLIVGYTPTSWIVQNSYGIRWAYNGIGHLERDPTGIQPRMCNLAYHISRPIV